MDPVSPPRRLRLNDPDRLYVDRDDRSRADGDRRGRVESSAQVYVQYGRFLQEHACELFVSEVHLHLCNPLSLRKYWRKRRRQGMEPEESLTRGNTKKLG
jgi:hypothetical protein